MLRIYEGILKDLSSRGFIFVNHVKLSNKPVAPGGKFSEKKWKSVKRAETLDLIRGEKNKLLFKSRA